jgi:hypothetical protein
MYFRLPKQGHPPARCYQARGIDIMNIIILLVWHMLKLYNLTVTEKNIRINILCCYY